MSINDMFDVDILPVFVIVGLLLICVIPIGLTMGRKANSQKNLELYGDRLNLSHNPEIEIIAKVIEKRSVPHPYAPSVSVNYLLFEQNDGVRKEFAIRDPGTFAVIVKGDVGLLKYHSNCFVSFDIIKEESNND
ncbi:MAG: hypothetical protein IKL09_01150 [Clostridia bacterium]|nr:hypothetical protein [Clostridia bacterium]